ncbi:hypothetical protein [Allobaculum mucilyticum]|uniref:hypothetical protein n=1 Tax=Allobaculum mucilyticum TaxID=2834459 RepID=UPI001E380C4E|nr:hypothetical protein [Allobaculum mucilyticum]UNT96490.1 hypothetical protein KWG62_01635 [Allobaculum mucilyticum]
MKTVVLSRKEFEIMVTIWNLNRPASFNDILEANPEINRNTLLAALRKLQNYGMVKVAGFGYHKNSLTRLFESSISMTKYFSQFMTNEQKKQMIAVLNQELSKSSDEGLAAIAPETKEEEKVQDLA